MTEKKKFNPEKMKHTVDNLFQVLDSVTGNARARIGVDTTPLRQRIKQQNQPNDTSHTQSQQVPQQQTSDEVTPQQVPQAPRLGSRIRGLLPTQQPQISNEQAELQAQEYQEELVAQEESLRAEEHKKKMSRVRSSSISLGG